MATDSDLELARKDEDTETLYSMVLAERERAEQAEAQMQTLLATDAWDKVMEARKERDHLNFQISNIAEAFGFERHTGIGDLIAAGREHVERRDRAVKAEREAPMLRGLPWQIKFASGKNDVSIIGDDGVKRTYRFNSIDWELIDSVDMVNAGRERLEKAEAACSWLRGGLSNAEGMLNRGEKARFVASYCREKLSCTDAGRKYMERLERAEAACARIQEALHLVVGGPMPVTPDSLRELADFMEKQRDE